MYQFDTQEDYLFYDATFFVDIFNSYKTKQLEMKSDVTLLSYKRVIGFRDLPPLFLNIFSHQNVSFSLYKSKMYFSPESYISDGISNLYVPIKYDIRSHSTLPHTKSPHTIFNQAVILSPPEPGRICFETRILRESLSIFMLLLVHILLVTIG